MIFFIGFIILLLQRWSSLLSKTEEANVATHKTSTTMSKSTQEKGVKEELKEIRMDTKYIVIIDAGSSGSRVHIFEKNEQYRSEEHYATKRINPDHLTMKSRPGLSSFGQTPTDAGGSLWPLIEFAKDHIPATQVSRTPILLKATAGMRLLQQIHPTGAELIMESVNMVLNESGFLFSSSQSQIISGQDEGMLGWLALNYLYERSKENHSSLRGTDLSMSNRMWTIFEMGGASVQISIPLSSNEHSSDLQSYIVPYTTTVSERQGSLYTHSFLGLGIESAKEQIKEALLKAEKTELVDVLMHPCLPKNFQMEKSSINDVGTIFTGTGEYAKCKELVKKVLFRKQNKESCQSSSKVRCLWNGIASPRFQMDEKIWAFENFFYVLSGVGVISDEHEAKKVHIKDYKSAAKQICSIEWNVLEKEYPKDNQPKEFNKDWCFSAIYIYEFLTKGLGLSLEQEITVGNSVDSHAIDWALGAALQYHS